MTAAVDVDPRFTELLHQLRHERGLSLRGLARRVHYSHSYLWDIETGLKPPTRKLAVLVDAALGAGGQLAAMVTDRPLSPPDRRPMRSAPAGAELAVQMRELVDQEQPIAGPDAARWAQLATWLYDTFVRSRTPLVRLGALRYSRRMWGEGASPFRAEVASQGRTPHVVCHSVTQQSAPDDVAGRLGIAAGSLVTRRENWYYADGEPVQICVTYIPVGISDRSPLATQRTLGPGALYGRFEDLGYRVARIHEQITTRLPTRHECVVLKIEPTVPVLDLLHTGYDAAGEPFEVSRFAMRADLMTVQYELAVG